jgi:hypothetical protein
MAAMESKVTENRYSLTSRVLATSGVDRHVDNTSFSYGFGQVLFSASYQVNQPATFDRWGAFGGLADVNAEFSLSNGVTGETYYQQSLNQPGAVGAEN